MPTYEYRCPQGHVFEKFYSTISRSEANVACPQCGEMAERMISGGAGLLFKGSGFYITDYGKDGKKDQRAAKPAAESSKPAGDTGGAAAAPSSGSEAAKPAAPASTPAPSTKPSTGSSGASGSAA